MSTHIYLYVCIHAYINVYMHFSPRNLCAYIDCVHAIDIFLPSLSQITHEQPVYTYTFKHAFLHTAILIQVHCHSYMQTGIRACTFQT